MTLFASLPTTACLLCCSYRSLRIPNGLIAILWESSLYKYFFHCLTFKNQLCQRFCNGKNLWFYFGASFCNFQHSSLHFLSNVSYRRHINSFWWFLWCNYLDPLLLICYYYCCSYFLCLFVDFFYFCQVPKSFLTPSLDRNEFINCVEPENYFLICIAVQKKSVFVGMNQCPCTVSLCCRRPWTYFCTFI